MTQGKETTGKKRTPSPLGGCEKLRAPSKSRRDGTKKTPQHGGENKMNGGEEKTALLFKWLAHQCR
jgi:hypothetical protein